MAVLPRLSDLELFLLMAPSDEEESPWMVMADLQVRDVDLLKPILILHAERNGLPWYVASYLKIGIPRPVGEGTLEAAPDLLVADAADRLRSSWNVVTEGKAPEFVLEVASGKSWTRDHGDKPSIYDGMGVLEYVLFAPERDDGPKLSGWRRDAAGAFAPWSADENGVLWCETLGSLGLYVEGGLWLRALDAAGRRLPTPRELAAEERRRADAESVRASAEAARAAEAAAARVEAERRAAEAERRAAEAERRAAEERAARAAEAVARAAAEAELERLREELRRLHGERE